MLRAKQRMATPLSTLIPAVPLNRGVLQQLSRIRLKESRILLKNGCYEGAYYLAGYAVECALKACVGRRTRRYDFPDKRLVDASYTHDLGKLVKVAGLELELEKQAKASRIFQQNWALVKDWTEESRYHGSRREKAHDLYLAIASRRHGVLRWITQHW